MMESKSPFGPATQKYWNRRHQYFDKFDDGIETDAEGLYSVVPQEVGAQQAALLKSSKVVDGFAGIGGNTIAFAFAGKHVVAIDANETRLTMCRHNAGIYGVDGRIDFVHGDFVELVPKFADAGAVYLDPPWGGPAYKEQGAFTLRDFDLDGDALLDLVVPLFDEVLLRVPRTFDEAELERHGRGWRVLDDLSAGRTVSRSALLTR